VQLGPQFPIQYLMQALCKLVAAVDREPVPDEVDVLLADVLAAMTLAPPDDPDALVQEGRTP
jgi:hypothetical protein